MTKTLLAFSNILPLVLTTLTCAADPVNLQPNATLPFEFPDLPATLTSMLSGGKTPAVLTAQLPENYTPGGKFPICVYLVGGDGGRGDSPNARALVGPRDFICVSLPLFKHAVDRQDAFGGLIVSMDDLATIGHAYQVMLQKLFDTVHNITPERSALGGFSNGAHSIGVLLGGQDAFILSHFRSFFLIEGGLGPLAANLLQKSVIRPCRFLVLLGDQPGPSARGREAFLSIGRGLDLAAQELKVDYTTIIMHGRGHEEPPEYMKLVAAWDRGENRPEAGKD